MPPCNQTPIKSTSSHLLWKSLLINHPCFKPFKTASEVSIHKLWPLALLHVTPLACLLAATVSVSNLLLIHNIPAAYVTHEHNFFFHYTSIFPFFTGYWALVHFRAIHQFLLLKRPVWPGTAVAFNILKSHAQVCSAWKMSTTLCILRN